METNERKENKMGVLPVNRLLVTMSAPIMLSMLVSALYNIVDGVFVARISENAFNAVGLAFPVQNLMIAVSTGTGVGINSLLSRSLGEKNFDRANRTASNAIFLALCSALVFAVVGGLGARQFFLVQTDVAEIVEGGTAYVRICCLCSFGIFLQITFERLLQATGKTVYSMVTQLTGSIINLIFDPIFIFVFHMGVAGAAWATVLGQIAAAILSVFLNARVNTEITLNMRHFRPDGPVIRRIYAVGIPSIFMSAVSSVMTFGMNRILIAFTTTATAVSGAYFKLQSFVFMPVFGLNNGLVPIVAYNFGAKKPDRMMKTVKLAICYAVGIMFLGFLAFQLLPDVLLGIFDASDYMRSIGVPALRIISIHFLIAGFSVVSMSIFQALGHGVLSLTVSLVRQLAILLPVAWLLSLRGQLELVWWAFPIAEVFSLALAAVFLRYVYKEEILPLR